MPSMEVDSIYDYFRQGRRNKFNGRIKHLFEKEFFKSSINRQNYKKNYIYTGDIRWGRPTYLTSHSNFKRRVQKDGYVGLPLDIARYKDLNITKDWKIAEKLFKAIKKI